jgi:hypothetical protein
LQSARFDAFMKRYPGFFEKRPEIEETEHEPR